MGGYSTLRRLLEPLVSRQETFCLLDVGAASGDMGASIRRRYPGARIVALDYLPSHLAQASGERVAGDAFRLPFRAGAFDFVFSSLFLHHFSDEAIVQLLGEFRKLARRAVLAIDLERGAFAREFIPATRWFFRWHPITLHDAPASVDAAFKREELQQLAARAGLRNVSVKTCRPWARLALVGITS
ncbi:MAG: methyltransferase domain-containing protein [Acidobacteriaceae bacterium]|nr:methyltransferase domain-containing protein [Acidobacteriaceae bacterium]